MTTTFPSPECIQSTYGTLKYEPLNEESYPLSMTIGVWTSIWTAQSSDGSSQRYNITLFNGKKLKDLTYNKVTTYIQIDEVDPLSIKERKHVIENNGTFQYSISPDHFIDLEEDLKVGLTAEKINSIWEEKVKSNLIGFILKKPESQGPFFSIYNPRLHDAFDYPDNTNEIFRNEYGDDDVIKCCSCTKIFITTAIITSIAISYLIKRYFSSIS